MLCSIDFNFPSWFKDIVLLSKFLIRFSCPSTDVSSSFKCRNDSLMEEFAITVWLGVGEGRGCFNRCCCSMTVPAKKIIHIILNCPPPLSLSISLLQRARDEKMSLFLSSISLTKVSVGE